MQGWPVTGTQPLPPECQVLDPRTGLRRSLWGLLAHLLQAVLVQYTEGTQRLEELVSKMMVKVLWWGADGYGAKVFHL